MKFCFYGKDGGEYSTVSGYWLAEIKRLFSAVLLCFEDGSRDAYHSHAFNCFSWVLNGRLIEHHLDRELVDHHIDARVEIHEASWVPFMTYRDTFHKVVSEGRTWVLSFRGPWAPTWQEYLPGEDRAVTLTDGRREMP